MARRFLGTVASLLSNWVTFKDVAPVRNVQFAAYSVAATDLGKLIECSGTWTLGTLAAATAGAGFHFYVKKTDGLGVVTIDPNLLETIDTHTTIALYGGEASYMIWTDGTAWYTRGRQKGWIGLLNEQPLALVTTGFGDTELSRIDIDYRKVGGVAAQGWIRVQKAGSLQIGTTYAYQQISTTAGVQTAINQSAAAAQIYAASSGAATTYLSGQISIEGPNDASPTGQSITWLFTGGAAAAGTAPSVYEGGGLESTASAMQGLSFFSNGTAWTGTMSARGWRG